MTKHLPFWEKVAKGESCWFWLGYTRKDGYGYTSHQNVLWLAHRLAWVLSGNELPENLHLHHTCENRACVNPEHLKLISSADHRRLHRSAFDCCPHGHPYSGVKIKPNGTRQRVCRTCNIEAGRRFRERKEKDVHLRSP